MNHFLVGDIGGTNARFGLVTVEGAEVFGIETLSSQNFRSLCDAVKHYLSMAQCIVPPKKACFAVASPITADEVHLTNSHWSFSIRRLQQQLGLDALRVINDFEAVARSIPHLDRDDKHQIGSGVERDGATKSVLGAGTGLGTAILAPLGSSGYLPLSTEGGHAGFSPVTDREYSVKQLLQKQLRFVSNESLLSGSGLQLLYQALAQLDEKPCPKLSAHDIADRALAEEDAVAIEAFHMFFEILGSVAGDYALQTGAKGGIYIGGGIAPRYCEFIEKNSNFRTRFEDKGRFSHYLRDIATFIIMAPQPGLIGAAAVLDNEGEIT